MKQNIQISDFKLTKYKLHISNISNIGHLGAYIS